MRDVGPSRRVVLGGAVGLGLGWAAPSAGAASAGAPVLRTGQRGPAVTTLQRRLAELGYWCASADGVFGASTAQAVVALQKVCGLERDGIVGPATRGALARGLRPGSRRGGDRLEVDTARQVVLVVRGGVVRHVLSTSTGNGESFVFEGRRTRAVTPSGEFRIRWHGGTGWDRGELGVLWRPYYFVGGIALHGSQSVPPYPASHGCCRLTCAAQDFLIGSGLLTVGEAVSVY